MTSGLFGLPARIAGIAALALGLAGCIDAKVDIEVLSETTARATMTQEMGADFYSMVKMSEESEKTAEADSFCAGGDLTENTDGSATCVIVEEGAFADLNLGDGQETGVTFTQAGPGLVRVALDTSDMAADIGAGEEMDEETKQMMQAFFTGHAITVRVSGGTITETNMGKAADGAAETVIPFLDIINGTVDLPAELYAVVRIR